MAVKIRLRRQGRTHRPFYRLVVCDSRRPRDGRYVESVGWYNPFEDDAEKKLSVKADRIQFWVDHGANMSEKAEALIARAAPSVVKGKQEKEIARRARALAKRKEKKAAKA